MYSTAASQYHKMPEHTDTFSTSLHDSKNSAAAQIPLSCTRPLTDDPHGQLPHNDISRIATRQISEISSPAHLAFKFALMRSAD